jgi:SAM-dependent methyltransferase
VLKRLSAGLNWRLLQLNRKLYRAATYGLSTGPHITRYFMYQHLVKFAADRPSNARVLSISHSGQLAELLGFLPTHVLDAAFPEFNIFQLPFAEGEFDAVVSDQVLEHVEGDPQDAINETFRILKSGGLALHTTCFMNPLHLDPDDFWRFTPNALKLLCQNHGTILDVGGWGNPYVWTYCGLGLQFEPIPHATWHPAHWLATKNTQSWPIVTWVLVRKT